jgi:hypothetical protein
MYLKKSGLKGVFRQFRTPQVSAEIAIHLTLIPMDKFLKRLPGLLLGVFHQ